MWKLLYCHLIAGTVVPTDKERDRETNYTNEEERRQKNEKKVNSKLYIRLNDRICARHA